MAEAVSLTNARTVKLCQQMRIIQQMDGGIGSTDTVYLQRVLDELALGDPQRGIQPWDIPSLGESAQNFLEFAKQAPGLTLTAEGNAALGLSLAEPTHEDSEATLVLAAKEHYRVVKGTQLRASKEVDSEKTGSKLEKGEVIEAVESREIPDAQREHVEGAVLKRVRIDDGTRVGWASTTGGKDGHVILEQISDDDLPLAIAMSKTDLPKLEEKIWQNYLDTLEKADKKQAADQKKRAISSKATTMSKEPYHKKLSLAVELAKKGGFTPDEMRIIHIAYMIEGHMDGGVWCKVQFDASRVGK
jgi:hypothetical protein